MIRKIDNIQEADMGEEKNVAQIAHNDSRLWTALKMLEAALCTQDCNGRLTWLTNDLDSVFEPAALPNNLKELGILLGEPDLIHKLKSSAIIYGIRKYRSKSANFEIREEVETGLLTLRNNCNNPTLRLEDDKEAIDLLKAMDEHRICLYRQPIIDTKNYSLKRFECLARMLREDGTIANPIEFIPAAERAGLIARLDISALNLALDQIRKDKSLKLAVNVSAATIADYNARQEYEHRLCQNENISKNITIEITETIAIHDLDIAANFANKVKSAQARIAMDDFGAGHTSFRALQVLPLDEVKIDGNFIENIDERKDNRAFVRAIQGLCSELRLETIAERVETTNEAAILSEIGVSGLQGYLFGKPQ